MRALAEAYGRTIESGGSLDMADQLACIGLRAIDTDSGFVACTRLPIAGATPILRTAKAEGVL